MGDEHLGAQGRVTEVLSEHLLEGMLEGYVLSGRHGMLNTYEAFAHIIDSMVGQYAKWLESSTDIDWRVPVSNLSILLSSHVWRQDHNGFSHQDPGFLDVVASKQQDLVRIKLPADANTLLAVATHAMETTDRIEVIVAGKHPEPVFLSLDDAVAHAAAGAGVWDWAGTESTVGRADVVPRLRRRRPDRRDGRRGGHHPEARPRGRGAGRERRRPARTRRPAEARAPDA